MWFLVAYEGCGCRRDEEGDFANAFYTRARKIGEEFVLRRWWVMVCWYFAWWRRRSSWILQTLGRLGEVRFYGGDAGGIACGGAIEMVEGFVAGLEVEFQEAETDLVSICVEAVTDYILKRDFLFMGEGRGATLGQEGAVEGDGCLPMET